jgi:hypothetical protein
MGSLAYKTGHKRQDGFALAIRIHIPAVSGIGKTA